MTAILTLHADGYYAGTRHRPHQHDELHLSLVLSGQISETVCGTTEFAGALSVVAKDSGVIHANDFGPSGARMARLTLKDGTIDALVGDPARRVAWRWRHDASVARPYVRLVRRGRAGTTTFGCDDPDLVDLLAALTARRAPPVKGTPPRWLALTVAELRSEWSAQKSVADVARRAGVHPVYLARCLRRWYGTGVAEELRRLRLQSAAAAMLEAKGTISDIAHSRGFSDEAHLCRDFHRAIGMSPGRYRALVKQLDYVWRGGHRRTPGFGNSSHLIERSAS